MTGSLFPGPGKKFTLVSTHCLLFSNINIVPANRYGCRNAALCTLSPVEHALERIPA